MSYQSVIDRYTRPRWAETPIASLKALVVEHWPKHSKLAPKKPREYRGVTEIEQKGDTGTNTLLG
ncbi:MAG: hypothetical protein ACREP9_05700, partial [Candidatus Dormibacteraceae bacterium]